MDRLLFGCFTALIYALGSVTEISTADIDSNGAPDLLAVVRNKERLVWIKNDRNEPQPPITPMEIDELYAAINAGSDDEEFDWNKDGQVTAADVGYLVANVVGTVRGDTDLDGDVDFSDFLAAARAFGQQNVGWAGGDFDGSGVVEFAEMLVLFSNFGFNADNE